MAIKKKSKRKQFFTSKNIPLKSNTLKKIVLLAGIFVLACILFFIAFPLLTIFAGLGVSSVLDHSIFSNYEAFSKNVMPANYMLNGTSEEQGSIDTPIQVIQKYQYSGTRIAVIEQLQPIFTSRGYASRLNIYGGKYDDNQEFISSKNNYQQYPGAITLNFIPNDCDTPPPNLPKGGCVKYGWRDPHHVMHTQVNEIDITWATQ